jgi:hypothetical protein
MIGSASVSRCQGFTVAQPPASKSGSAIAASALARINLVIVIMA